MSPSGGCSQNEPVRRTRAWSMGWAVLSAAHELEEPVEHGGVLLDRQDQARAQHDVQLRGRDAPRLAAAQIVERAHAAAVLVVGADRGLRSASGSSGFAPASTSFATGSQVVPIERAAHLRLEVLRHVEVVHELVGEHHLPHARQVADHVADGREDHAVEAVEAAVQTPARSCSAGCGRCTTGSTRRRE